MIRPWENLNKHFPHCHAVWCKNLGMAKIFRENLPGGHQRFNNCSRTATVLYRRLDSEHAKPPAAPYGTIPAGHTMVLYFKALQERRSSRLRGLYQYNEIGTLEQLGVSVIAPGAAKVSPGESRSLQIIEALSGKIQ